MSETYTAVYGRDGDVWVAAINGMPGLERSGTTLGEARQQIRDALAGQLTVALTDLHIIDQILPPSQIVGARIQRSAAEKAKMLGNMTDQKKAGEWADELALADRDSGAVKWLRENPDVELGIDQLCHTVTLAEEISRWGEVDLDSEAPSAEHAPGTNA